MLLWIVALTFLYQHMQPQLALRVGVRISPDRAILLAAVIGFVLLAVSGKIQLRRFGVVELAMLLFTLVCTLSWLQSGVDEDTERGLRWLNTLFNLSYFPFLAFVIMKHIPYSQAWLRRVLGALCLVGVYLGVTAILEHFQVRSLVWPGYILDRSVSALHWGRARGPFLSASVMGHALIVTFLSTLVALTCSDRGKKWALLGLMGLSFVGIYFTYTRSIWVGFGVTLVVLLFAGGPTVRKHLGLIVVMLALAIGSGLTAKLSLQQTSLFGTRQSTVDYRLLNYQVAWEVIKANPLLGVGYGKFGKELEKYYQESIDGLAVGDTERDLTNKDGNHNTYLGLLAEVGFVGFSLYLVILGGLFLMCVRIYRRLTPDQRFERAAVAMGMAMIAVIAMTGQFSDLRFDYRHMAVMFLWLGALASMQYGLGTRKEVVPKTQATAPRLIFNPQHAGDLRNFGESLRSGPTTK